MRAAAGYAAAAGALHYLVAPFLLKRVMVVSISALELGAGFGAIVGLSAFTVGVTRTWTATQNRHLQRAVEEFGVRWVNVPSTPRSSCSAARTRSKPSRTSCSSRWGRAGEVNPLR